MDTAADQTARSEKLSVRLGMMYAALGASNEAILRAKTRDELFKWVCDAAVHGSKFSNATVILAVDESKWMTIVASTGITALIPAGARISIDESLPEGRGTVGTAFRTQKPCVTNDYQNDPRLVPWHEVARKVGWNSAAVFPLIQRGVSIGVLGFNSFEKDTFDEEVVALLQRVAENVSFALDNFQREEERVEAEQRLRESEARFRSLTALSSDWYWEQDAQFRFTRLEGRQVTNGESLPAAGYLGMTRWDAGLEMDGGWDAHRASLMLHLPYRDAVMYRILPDGTRRYISISGEPMTDASGKFIGYRGVGKDVTAQKMAEERIQHLATHDGLTGLPNRLMFSQLLNMALQSARRYDRSFAVLFIDLDRFKIINDTLGHESGDMLLQETARRLTMEMRASDVVARLGGDEFVILVQEVSEQEQVAIVARKILSSVIKPMTLDGQECRITASIGICMFPACGSDEQTLMKNADMAMYLAKEQGKNNFQFYTEGIKSLSLERLTLESSLRRALERGEFFLHYQPKLDLTTGAINGAEALLRWQHPELGVVMPGHFIALAEETGLIVAIGRWVLRTACEQSMAWQRAGLRPICMAVNLSARQFSDEGLLQDLATVLKETGIDPILLEMEITEGMAMQNLDLATKVLTQMKEMGVRIAVDDFGTGYSSLAQIKRFPIDTLKVDRSFIRDLINNPEDRAITEAIIAMGKTLSLTVVAEGVETKEQETFLRDHDCDESQGYYFSKPTSADVFADLLRNHIPKRTAKT
jgi:diguanylate cyclase (GGDEF)-like protein/PAS domain S-box-containing protein